VPYPSPGPGSLGRAARPVFKSDTDVHDPPPGGPSTLESRDRDADLAQGAAARPVHKCSMKFFAEITVLQSFSARKT
jgi:hypothetical protein